MGLTSCPLGAYVPVGKAEKQQANRLKTRKMSVTVIAMKERSRRLE